jgi:hypothetical protein
VEIQPEFPVPGWPSEALPDVYELRAELKRDAEGWGAPEPALRVVDLREGQEAVVTVPRRTEALPTVAVNAGEQGIAATRVVARVAPELSSQGPKDDHRALRASPGNCDLLGNGRTPSMSAR